MFRGESQPEKERKAPVKFVEKNQKGGGKKRTWRAMCVWDGWVR